MINFLNIKVLLIKLVLSVFKTYNKVYESKIYEKLYIIEYIIDNKKKLLKKLNNLNLLYI